MSNLSSLGPYRTVLTIGQGPPGVTGAPGPAGAQGPKGDQGPIGSPASTLLPMYEAIFDGAFVNVFNHLGTVKLRLADATDTDRICHGYVLIGGPSGADAVVYFQGVNTAVVGAPLGPVFLSTTVPGAVQSTAPPLGSGYVCQRVGIAVSPTAVIFNQGPVVVV